MKKRLLNLLLVLVLIVGLVSSGSTYFSFVSRTVYEESTAHLTEIFHQANQALYNLVFVNWSRMRMWAPYIGSADSKEDIIKYVEKAREESYFTDFYFISRDGNYTTLNGERGYLDLRMQLPSLVQDHQPVVVSSVVPDKPEIIVFAIPVEHGYYDDFEYEAIAISYNNSDLVEALKISAFEGQASTFAVLPDGRVIVDNGSEEMRNIHNFLALLENADNLNEEDIKNLHNDFVLGNSGKMAFSIDGRSYYLVYEPAGFQDWIVLGIAPTDVVNAGMNKLQSIPLLWCREWLLLLSLHLC